MASAITPPRGMRDFLPADKAKRDSVRAGLAKRGLLNGYVTADGEAAHHVLSPVRVEAGFVTAFDHTADEIRSALQQLSANGVKGLVLDLRWNPGGLLTSALEIADFFVAGDRLLRARRRRGNLGRHSTRGCGWKWQRVRS